MLLLIQACKTQQINEKEALSFDKVNYNSLVDYTAADDFDLLLDYAKQNDDLVFLEFYADWCLPCNVMKKSIYQDADLTNNLNANFVNYRVDYDSPEGKDLAFLFQAIKLPALYFLNNRGQVITTHQGALGKADFLFLMEQAEIYKTMQKK